MKHSKQYIQIITTTCIWAAYKRSQGKVRMLATKFTGAFARTVTSRAFTQLAAGGTCKRPKECFVGESTATKLSRATKDSPVNTGAPRAITLCLRNTLRDDDNDLLQYTTPHVPSDRDSRAFNHGIAHICAFKLKLARDEIDESPHELECWSRRKREEERDWWP